MVRVAALKNAVAEGDTAPDLAGLTPAQQLQRIAERAHAHGRPALRRARRARSCPALAERGVRLARPDDLEPVPRAALARYFRDEVLPALTPLAIDASRPFPMLAEPEPQPRGAARARRGEERARGSPWSRCPAGLPRLVRAARHDGLVHAAARGRDPGRARDAVPGPGDPRRRGVPRRARRRARPRRRGRARLPAGDRGGAARTGGAAASCGSRSRAGSSEPLLALLASRLEVAPEDVYRIARAARRAAAARRSSTCPRSRTCATRRCKPAARARDRPAPELFALLDERDVLLHHPYESFEPGGGASSAARPTTPTCSRSSRRSTARAATRRSCARWRAPPRTASR